MAEYIILIVYCNQLLHYTSIIQYYNKGLAQVGQTGPIPAPILGYTAKRWWQWWWERGAQIRGGWFVNADHCANAVQFQERKPMMQVAVTD